MSGSPMTIYVSVADRKYLELSRALAAFYKSKGSNKGTYSGLIMKEVKNMVDREVEFVKKQFKVDLEKEYYEWKMSRGDTLHEYLSNKNRGGHEYNRKLDKYFEKLGESLSANTEADK